MTAGCKSRCKKDLALSPDIKVNDVAFQQQNFMLRWQYGDTSFSKQKPVQKELNLSNVGYLKYQKYLKRTKIR